MSFRLEASRIGSADLLVAAGSLDATSADGFLAAVLERLEEGDAQRLVLDFSGVEYLSSAGMRVLVIAARQARIREVPLALAGARPMIAELLQIARFDTLATLHPDVQDALDAAFDPVAAPTREKRRAGAPAEGIVVSFWGTRGSLPAPLGIRELRRKIASALLAGHGAGLDTLEKARAFADALPFGIGGTFGGNTACIELDAGPGRFLFLDMGSGARAAGHDALRRLGGRKGEVHVLMSHLHWDHVMGFPFFGPAYVPGNRIVVHGCHASLEAAFRRQQEEPGFPVGLDAMAADIRFDRLEPEQTVEIAGFQVTPRLQQHGGDSYAYRIERGGRCVVYSTDAEHKPEDAEDRARFIELFRGADLVIFDAMYSLAESVSVREDWGHSSNVVGVELCQRAGARRLALFHHEPVNDDLAIERLCQDARRLEAITGKRTPLQVLAAYDGLELAV